MPSEGVPKCQRCRKDHKRCLPESRSWPGPKCDRCESYGYECSENMMARRSSQRDVESTRSINRAAEGRLGSYPQSPTRQLSTRAPQSMVIGSIPVQVPCQSPFSTLFLYLKNVDWLHLSCPPAEFGSDPFAAMFRSSTCPVPNLLGPPLGKRQLYLEVWAESEKLKRTSQLPYNMPLDTSIITTMVTKLQREHPRRASMSSFEDLSQICGSYIHYGACWNKLRTSLHTDEVLLIDPEFSFDIPNPRTTFESAQQIWLYQISGLKEFCQKLSGLSQMILNLAQTGPNSPVRPFLASKILDRLNEVLGPGVPPPSVLNHHRQHHQQQPQQYPQPHHTSFLSPAPTVMEDSPVDLRDGESDDSFSFDENAGLQAGFGAGYVYQGPWNS
ncbi:hypothetical protein FQN55_002663 [Onygenales sp. PD_40]|nr:hypothetical protein FQN55_002663 [Onygenales sp. PD_40]KAK2789031.1 hypothetical protein FQN52_006398 [Onygenales sp. PD_12]KAK2801217.1 hypothetical protein FQN51_005532 [Onygenales sp. PD_10]